MSRRVPDALKPQIAPAAWPANKPFLVMHRRTSRAILEQSPVDLTYREYPIAYEARAESLADVTNWLSARLDDGA